MRQVLFIAYYFPPLGGAGVQRALKFIRYLPASGWQPTVLTQRGSGFKRDETLLGEVPPDIAVIRALSLETSNLITPLSRIGVKKKDHGPNVPDSEAKRTQARFNLGHLAYEGLSKLKMLLLKSILVPDANIGWLPACYTAAARILKTGHYDAVLTTSAPYTAHLVGALLRKRFVVPWVADFRDEWSTNPLMDEYMRWNRSTHRQMERWVLDTADAVITVSEESKRNFQALLNPLDRKGKVHAIYNGYDANDFPDRQCYHRGEKFVVSHVGTLAGRRQANDLFDALELLRKNDRDIVDLLQIRIIGSTDKIIRTSALNDSAGKTICFTGHVPHATAVDYMYRSDALWLVVAKEMGRQGLSGKIFEYLAAGRPIIAVVPPESEAARIIERTRSGVIVPNGHPQQLAAVLKDMVTKWKQGTLISKADLNEVAKFERRNLTGQLAAVLDESSHEVTHR